MTVLRQWRVFHRLTLVQAAQIFGVHWVTVQGWERDTPPPPGPVRLALRLLDTPQLVQDALSYTQEEETRHV